MIASGDLIKTIVAENLDCKVAIAGYAACGKTTISREIGLMKGAGVIPAEIWFYDRNTNLCPKLSGAHPKRYDIAKSVEDVSRLVRGEQIIAGEYDHGTCTFKSYKEFRVGNSYVLDGTIFSLEVFSRFVRNVYYLEPVDVEQWIQFAAHRDVVERGFEMSRAVAKNRLKHRDMFEVERASVRNLVKIKVFHDNNSLMYQF